ncbi:hypothetical protein [Streptomyces puniciscabiei]|uniref:hypothetical protein n=1 Tax=Streptomyces puniciscabiei TaxID=164348 RepID=UPI003788B2D9
MQRKLFGGGLLHFDSSGLGPEIGLMTFKVHDKATAKALPALLANRAQAPALPKETTSYTSFTVKSPPQLVPFLGEDSEELRCTRCGGVCGVIVKGEATVYPDCSACQRTVIKAHEDDA